jgi:hypothetical protein
LAAGWVVTAEHSQDTLQQSADNAPQAAWCFSGFFATYRSLIYTSGIHSPMPDNSETDGVEGVKAELRHYLARLGRKTRCFSRCLHALRRAVNFLSLPGTAANWVVSVFRTIPYPAHLIHFIYPCSSSIPFGSNFSLTPIRDTLPLHCRNKLCRAVQLHA